MQSIQNGWDADSGKSSNLRYRKLFIRVNGLSGLQVNDLVAKRKVVGANEGMAVRRSNGSVRRAALRVGLAVALALSSTACANHSYMGISLAPSVVTPEVQGLARRAQAGDKQAQLDLGIMFEEGNGVSVDIRRAIKLYRMAASDSGGTVWIYSPATARGTKGRVLPVGTGMRRQGLEMARKRLEMFHGR